MQPSFTLVSADKEAATDSQSSFAMAMANEKGMKKLCRRKITFEVPKVVKNVIRANTF